MSFFGFNKLKFFNFFAEYFIGIMSIYILVVFVLLTSNIYGILIQKVVSEIVAFILFLTCFFILQENFFLGWDNVLQVKFNGFNKFTILTPLTIFSKFAVSFFSVVYFLIISDFLRDYKITSFEYLLLLTFAVLGLLLLCGTNDFLSTFLSIELISLSSYFLASFRKVSSYSLEAGIKYLVVGAISSTFFLMGSSFIYAYSGSIIFSDINFILTDFSKILINCCDSAFTLCFFKQEFSITLTHYNFLVNIGAILVVLSIFIKLALAPFHVWSLDVYEGSPSISTFFFSTITKLSFFVFLYRFCFLTFYDSYDQFWIFYSIIIGFLSVLFGSFGGLRQKKIKTLLAYSSISHMGYALLSFSTFSSLGFEMLFFYLISYVISNIIVWYIVLGLKKPKNNSNKRSKDISDFILLSKSNKFLAFSLSIAFFSLAGIPPLLGFIAKFGIFLTLILEQFYSLAILIILCSVVSTFYYIRVVKVLYFENLLVGKLYSFNSKNILILCFSVCLLIFLFIKPTVLYLIIHKMVLFENLPNYKVK
jgi:NADH-quinone oxidoreductase subunit N|uniref:NADH dehydrogenase subunit 2 n=1 Tax=Entomoneis sp. TaxID=186043 RepID=A0A3G1PWC4_9STRA|nr:NADH dehydrogenase subunit 2 [Entomoneis sp.]